MTNRKQFQFFPFHLVDMSPWPILTSFSAFLMAISAVLSFHGFANGGRLLLLGFVLTASVMVLWFKDVITEGTYLGDHTTQVRKGLTIGFVLFVVSEVFAFLSIFWAFFHSSLAPDIALGSTWPPIGVVALDPFAVPLLNTVLLLSSGAFITWAHHGLIQGNRKAAIYGTIITIIFALLFTGLQYLEYKEAGFTIADSVFGSAFFASTGLHGLHVIIGTTFISFCLIRIVYYHLTDAHHVGFEAAILYWHFVDVVWLFLFLSVYYWGGN
jgi:cytochrome c oxidase subunit 3